MSPIPRQLALALDHPESYAREDFLSGPGNEGGFAKSAHSVLTGEVRTDPPNQAADARDRMISFLRERLAS